MAAAGVRFLGSVVSSRIADVVNPTLDASIGARITSRRGQLARVLDPVANGSIHSIDLEVLGNVQCYAATTLLIQFSIEAFSRRDFGEVEEVKAYFEPGSQSLYFVPKRNEIPWAAIAREISILLDGESESGRVALALMQVLSAPDLQSASTLLDELGFPPVEHVDTTVEPGVPVTDLGQEEAVTPAPPGSFGQTTEAGGGDSGCESGAF